MALISGLGICDPAEFFLGEGTGGTRWPLPLLLLLLGFVKRSSRFSSWSRSCMARCVELEGSSVRPFPLAAVCVEDVVEEVGERVTAA